ncbi:two-component system phosphate regulon response regulator OmpR [Rhizobium sp. PP-F2F-G38]|uniref:Response regulator transcription factor n=1 Tax=Ferranicluibacter rubi TaxID=2715133 RepID=A0AA44CDB9_9HYPH|nr:response regulator transcription factor [Ferranicluibacter rubi]PYE34056.1 two-component system phosphate regulon response regulator OmpR [Rhizobium sp. PP-WC-1G-195]PYE96692.1 two-component system phosphate regulon response regulator OmpR [Rhizobium sp. PP-F2F-G38]TCP86104.1 two-component system phosphate regulon response regulator OmpR [Rhizobium sp. PP-CC-2G-626]TCQ23623.1 two-component system phosphate regulon response regulator OmpR [Rhizobium sp. PP-CC-3G-465]NHT77346.1 response regul
MQVKILIVEDDPDMAEMLFDLVEAEGWTPFVAGSAEEATAFLSREIVHLILLDHNLPGASGRTFAQRIRSSMDVGIIMVTAAGSSAERVLGLETAADDYIVKPFEPIELAARMKAVLRRSVLMSKPERMPELAADLAPAASALKLGDWTVDLKRRLAVCDGQPGKTLTGAEFALLELLAETPNLPVTRSQILERLGSGTDRYVDRNVDVLVLRLRRKIEQNPELPRYIKTRRGRGYVLEVLRRETEQ